MKDPAKQNRFVLSPLLGFILLGLATTVAVSALTRESPGRGFWPEWQSAFQLAEAVGLIRPTTPVSSASARVSETTPAWLLEVMPGSSSSRPQETRYLSLDRSGDRTSSAISSSDTAVSSDNFIAFNPGSFGRLASAATFPVTSAKGPAEPSAPTLNTTYSWIGSSGALWNVNANWNPDTGFPNGLGDEATNIQSVNASTFQLTPGGVTVGRIRHAATTDTSWTISTSTSITLSQDGAGSAIGVIRNSDSSTGATNALIITGTGGLVLADNIDIVNDGGSSNPVGSVQLNTPISGTGNLNFVNLSSNFTSGRLALLAANSFTGDTTISVGAVSFANNSSFGVATNTIHLGKPAGGTASLVSSGPISAMPNNIMVEQDPHGILYLGGATPEQTNYTGTVALGSTVVLVSASTVSGGTARTTAFTNTISGMGGVSVQGVSMTEGFVELKGANTYLGGTTVASGTLLVNNTSSVTSGTGAGPVTVNPAATLGGSGYIQATLVTVFGGGTITGGGNGVAASDGAVGTLTLTSTSLNIQGIYLVDISGATADRLTLVGNLNLGGEGSATLDFNTLATPTAPLYPLITYTGTLSGTFGNVIDLPSGYMLEYNPGEIDLVAIVPEASTWIAAALALVMIGWSQRRRFRMLVAARP
jgi:autotransporter-associated beta strand protein